MAEIRKCEYCNQDHEPVMVKVPPTPGSKSVEWETWPKCGLMYYGGNGLLAVDMDGNRVFDIGRI